MVQTREQKTTRKTPWYGTLDCPVCHRTVSGAPGHFSSNSSPSGKSEGAPLKITGLPGVPAEQRLLRAQRSTATAFNALQCAQKSEHAWVAHRTVYRTCPVHHRTVRWSRRLQLQRSESNGYVTWQAHQTVSGGAPDCPVRHATAASTKRLVWWLGL